ncbi:MAG: acyltransferase [Blastocatellia bacterium]|nr:acyltransferase [Blastocatellia bacterium]
MDQSNPNRVNIEQHQAQRIASLDGLRAISIGLVLIGHLSGTRYFPFPKSVGDFFSLAEVGVIVFFVISGYLITTLLLQEVATTGRIHLLKFYFRRTLRIFPPYYTLLFVLILLRLSGVIGLSKADLFPALTYTSNYFTRESWYIGHTWSLAVEEQFYLLWPAALLWLGKRRAGICAAALLVLCPMLRTLAIFHIWHSPESTAFEIVADSLACGCLLALLREWLHQQGWYMRLLGARAFFVLPLLIVATSALHRSTKIYYSVGLSFINISAAICVDWCITWHDGKVGRWLNARGLVLIGVLSYSLYLWQQVFLNRTVTTIITTFPLNLALTSLAAMVSYYWIETPSLRLRQRLERRWFT